jgi:hypothetical protein
MNGLRRTSVVGLTLAFGLALIPRAAAAQNITLKTLPIPTGEQFLLFPSLALGMGGVGIALDDPVGAPFANPARRLVGGAAHVFATPTFYGESRGMVGGRSLPLAALFAGERLHGAFAVAIQELDDAPWCCRWFGGPGSDLIDGARSNTYLFGSLGARLGERTSVGVSAFHADLGAVDGVNLLYAQAAGIEQDGELVELRAGLAHDFGEERTLEATLTNTRLDMRHDVHYVEWRWLCDPWQPPPPGQRCEPAVRRWDELNEDRTVTWGTRLLYRQPLDEVSQVGFLLAGSTKAHPKIPNYNVVNIPRDPGNSTVFNIGAGLSHRDGPLKAALEVVFEPGRSHTWAFADTVVELPSGARLQPGDKTVDNEFTFRNMSVALGMDRDGERFGFQLGLRVRQIGYTLEQQHFLAEVERRTKESWAEWSPSWGAAWHLGALDLRYTGRFTARGFPDGCFFGCERLNVGPVADAVGVDFVVGATQPVQMADYRVTTHRITLSMPIGR